MARYLFPQDRLVFRYGAPGTPLYSPQGETLTIYADSAGTIPASLQLPDGTPTDNVLDIGPDCLIPEFKGPDTATTVWAKDRVGTLTPLYAQTGQFLAGTVAAVSSVNGEVGAVVLSAADVGAYPQDDGTALAGRVTAVESGRLLVANNLSDLSNPSAARAALSLGNAATRSVGTTSSTVAAGDAPSAAVTTHVAASDPHGDRAFTTTSVATHSAAADPHGDRAFATSAVTTHTGATDPHGDRAFTTSAITTHAGAADPHGDRAYADTAKLAKSANLSDVANPATARTNLGLSAIATASFGTTAGTVTQGNDARLSNARTPTAHAASHAAVGSDPVAVDQSQVAGLTAALAALLPLTGGTLTGSLTIDSAGTAINAVDRAAITNFAAYVLRTAGVDRWAIQLPNDSTNDLVVTDSANGVEVMRFVPGATQHIHAMADLTVDGYTTLQGGQFNGNIASFGDLSLIGTGKAYRMRRGGGGLDFEGAGADMIISMWSAGDFTGTQRSFIRLASDALSSQVAGKVEFVDGLYGSAKHVLDGTANQVGFYGSAPISKPTVTGSRADGTALQSLLTALANLGLITNSTTA